LWARPGTAASSTVHGGFFAGFLRQWTGGNMRRLTLGLLAASMTVGACTRAQTGPASSDRQAAAGAQPPAVSAAPKATTGPAETGIIEPVTRSADVREVTLPAGTRLPIVLDTRVGSDISRIEEPVHAHLARPVKIGGTTLVPAGSRLSGIVTDARLAGKVHGRAHVAVRFDTLVPAGRDERYHIDTAAVGRTAPGTKKKDALEIGIPAAGGALIGGLLGGTKGALIGTAAGGGAGTAIVLSTRGREIHLPRGAALTLRLVKPMTMVDSR